MGEKKRGLQHISRYRTEIMGFAILWIVLFHSAIPAPENSALRLIWYCVVSLADWVLIFLCYCPGMA